MYKINEFSKITGLPASTLRYYDRKKILSPIRDTESNYRYYSEAEFEKAKLLNILREHQFSIAEMKDILMTISDMKELSFYLKEKKDFLLAEIEQLNAQSQALTTLISDFEISEIKQDYQIVPVKLVEQHYIYQNYSGNYQQMAPVVNTLYSVAKEQISGHLFLLDEFCNDNINCQICLPVSQTIESTKIKQQKLTFKQGLQVTHHGPYQTIGKAYKYLIDYAEKNNLKRNGLFLTRFIKGSGKLFKGNENSYITEVVLLYDEEKKE